MSNITQLTLWQSASVSDRETLEVEIKISEGPVLTVEGRIHELAQQKRDGKAFLNTLWRNVPSRFWDGMAEGMRDLGHRLPSL